MTALRILLGSLGAAARSVRVWGTFLLLCSAAVAFVVLPIYDGLDQQLSHSPAAGRLVDQVVDADMMREHPELRPDLRGPAVFFWLLTLLLGGGVLACVGTDVKFRYGAFWAESGRLFLRNVRVVLVGLLPVLLVFWGFGALTEYLQTDLLRNTSPAGSSSRSFVARFLSPQFGMFVLNLLQGFVFLLLVFMSRLARAHLARRDRRSAVVAWAVALRRCLGRPFTTVLLVGGFCVALLVPTFGVGLLVAQLMEVKARIWPGFAVGMLGIAWLHVVNVALFLAARRFHERTSKDISAPADRGNELVSPVDEAAPVSEVDPEFAHSETRTSA